jgi:hypothetical protein
MTPATDDERAIAQAAELSRSLDDLQALLLRAIRTEDADAARRILAGPLDVAARGTLERLRSGDPA